MSERWATSWAQFLKSSVTTAVRSGSDGLLRRQQARFTTKMCDKPCARYTSKPFLGSLFQMVVPSHEFRVCEGRKLLITESHQRRAAIVFVHDSETFL